MRFGERMSYKINVDTQINQSDTYIPSMLLQPFVDNAVKHGISSLKENGSVQIEFRKIKADLRLSVTDNGKGFDSGKEYHGLGLQLSKSRIALFNTIYKDTPAQLIIDSSAQGTKVLITLNNWI